MAMSIFLRSGETGMYFADGGCWVGDRENCKRFPNPRSAFDCAAVEGLSNFEVVVSRESPRYEMVLTPEFAGSRQA